MSLLSHRDTTLQIWSDETHLRDNIVTGMKGNKWSFSRLIDPLENVFPVFLRAGPTGKPLLQNKHTIDTVWLISKHKDLHFLQPQNITHNSTFTSLPPGGTIKRRTVLNWTLASSWRLWRCVLSLTYHITFTILYYVTNIIRIVPILTPIIGADADTASNAGIGFCEYATSPISHEL